MENRNIVHHKATTAHTGILYITEKRNFVQHRNQEFCTTQKTGILYIADMMSLKRPCVVAEVQGSINDNM